MRLSDTEKQIRDSIHEAGHAVYAAKNTIIVLNSVTIHPNRIADVGLSPDACGGLTLVANEMTLEAQVNLLLMGMAAQIEATTRPKEMPVSQEELDRLRVECASDWAMAMSLYRTHGIPDSTAHLDLTRVLKHTRVFASLNMREILAVAAALRRIDVLNREQVESIIRQAAPWAPRVPFSNR